MGFDIQRFPNCIDEELICKINFFEKKILNNYYFLGSICGGVLQDPLQAPSCEHTFCQVKKTFYFYR